MPYKKSANLSIFHLMLLKEVAILGICYLLVGHTCFLNYLFSAVGKCDTDTNGVLTENTQSFLSMNMHIERMEPPYLLYSSNGLLLCCAYVYSLSGGFGWHWNMLE